MKSRLAQLPERFARQDKKLETRIATLYAAQRALAARAMKYALEHSNIGPGDVMVHEGAGGLRTFYIVSELLLDHNFAVRYSTHRCTKAGRRLARNRTVFYPDNERLKLQRKAS